MKRAAAAALALLLCACSMVRVAYDNAGAYLHWRAGYYLDVHGEAREALDAAIGDFLAWHRAQALPQYERLALEAARRVERGVTPGDLVWGYDSLLAQAREGLRAGAERAAPLLGRLDAAQLAHLESRFAEDNRRFARRFLRGTEEERRRRRVERIVERLEDWVGRLSQAQEDLVRRYSERAPLLGELRLRERERLQAEMLALLRSGRAAALPELAAGWDRGRDPAYAAALERARGQLYALLLELDRTASPEQRAHAAARLRRYADDFRALAERR